MQKIYTPATKSLNPWNVDDNTGWDIVGAERTGDERELVPTVADCIDEIAKSLADLPFGIYDKNGNLVDDSDDYKNVIGVMPDPYTFLWLTGASLVMSGSAYWRKKNNPAGFTKGLQYYAYENITPQILPNTTPLNLTFRRSGYTHEIPAKEVLYIWLPDARVEFGPAVSYPLKRALKAAGALSAISSFIDNYMNSGMVKAFIAQSEVPPSSEDEKKEMEDYLTRILTGVKRTLTRIRVIKKTMTITAIGGGLDELKNVGIVKEIKQDVLEAFGVPASRVWGNSANYATAANDTLVFVTSEIMPIARIIQNALNEQVFALYGYKLVFEPRRMEEFSVVLGEKVASLESIAKSFERAMNPAEALKASIDILGLELSPELTERIELSIAKASQPTPAPAPIIEPVTPQPPAVLPEPEAEPLNSVQIKALVELDKWRVKSIGSGKLTTWHAVNLSDDIVQAVKDGMTWSDAREAVKSNGVEITREPDPGIMALADAINRAADATKAAPVVMQSPTPNYTFNLTAQMPQPGEPSVIVQVPQQPTPIVTVNVPDQPAPNVTVQVPQQAAPVVNVTAIPGESRLIMPEPKPVVVVRDGGV
jgi:HK97 family phage portal protein